MNCKKRFKWYKYRPCYKKYNLLMFIRKFKHYHNVKGLNELEDYDIKLFVEMYYEDVPKKAAML